ncbi:MAG: DUF4191 domain-containing protein [Candidatus Ancillula trichonymphae]|jgi:hypothetical protein|nr:DUF4191 domain-containing protein [Candidatus Ancillula trichonymphae]
MTKGDKEPMKKRNVLRQIMEVYKMTKGILPKTPVYLATAFFVPFLVLLVVALLTSRYFLFVPLMFGVSLLAVLFVLSRLAGSAGFASIDGKPGAAGAVLTNMKFGGLALAQEPVAIDSRSYDMVFRGVGRSGVFFVTEGPTNRVKKMVDKEVQKIKRVLPNMQITVLNTGNDPGQVPLKKLKKSVAKVKPVLTKAELEAVRKRLHALGGFRLPIPKGMDPTKPPRGAKRALRGK